MLLQSGAIALYKKSGINGVIKWVRYYKVGNQFKAMQHRRQIRETGEGNGFWQSSP